MKDNIPGRELFTLEALGTSISGTCHLPPAERFRPEASHDESHDAKTTGVLMLSGLVSPRAAIGDVSVYWADLLAGCGYPCFRVDLPGTCDSGGETPADLMPFINSGSYEAVTVEIMKQIIARYNLSSVVIMGHCSGAVTALYAASAYKDCRGLVLLEPYFHLPLMVTNTRGAIGAWASRSRFGGILSNIFDRMKALRLRLRTSVLPGDANLPLIKRWKNLASAGLPILVLKVPGPKASAAKPRVGEFDYLAHAIELAGTRSCVDLQVVVGANHSFADRVGRLAVLQYTQSWLGQHFPVADRATSLRQSHGQQLAERSAPTMVVPASVHASIGQ